MRVLISGASIAGPVLTYWLTRRGFDVTVVERAPALRKTGGHAVDLFRPAMDISERMGVLPASRSAPREPPCSRLPAVGAAPARIDYLKLIGAVSDRHVEIMRDDLSEIYYDACRDDVEYRFGDRSPQSPTTATSLSSARPPGSSTSSSAPTDCTRECAG